MSSIYQKTVSDKTNILAPREYFIRPFDFQDWTEARFGILFSAVTSSGDNTDVTSESVAITTVADLVTFGIKDSATTALPGQAGSLFLGATSALGTLSKTFASGAAGPSFSANAGGNPETLAATAYAGVTKIGGTGSQAVSAMNSPTSASGATGYCGFYGIKFVINNLGLATQSVTISVATDYPIAGAAYTPAALRTLLNNTTYGTSFTLAWNDGVAARDIPDAFWIRMPFYSNRIRISAMMGVRYLP